MSAPFKLSVAEVGHNGKKKGKGLKKSYLLKKEPQKVAEVAVALQMGPISYLLTCTKPHVKYLSYYMHPTTTSPYNIHKVFGPRARARKFHGVYLNSSVA